MLGFGLSLITHLATYLGVNVARHVPFVWLLHVGIFLGVVAMLIDAPSKAVGDWSDTGPNYWRGFFDPMPGWVRYLSYGLFAYVVINFVLFLVLSREGSPDVLNGKYVLRIDGKAEEERVVREITLAEYDLREARILRGFSGHWLIFYLCPALFFWYSEKEARED